MVGFEVVLADPPWPFAAWSKRGMGRSPENHYRTLGIEEIKALPVADVCGPDCALFLWATGPNLPPAIDTIDSWGFRYSGVAFTWVKPTKSQECGRPTAWQWGCGFATRQNAEFCLLGVRGRLRRVSCGVHSVIAEPRGRHSAKPECIYERIETLLGDRRRLEMFGRPRLFPREGWTIVGNEATGRDIRDDLAALPEALRADSL